MDKLAMMAVLAWGIFVMALMFGTGAWILRPLSKEAQWARLPTRYTLSDFIWLLVVLQMALGAAMAAVPEAEFSATRWILLAFLAGSAAALWAYGTSSLSRAGVTQPLRRGAFTVFLLPATLVFLAATGLLGSVAPVVLLGGLAGHDLAQLAGVLGGTGLWLAVAWLLRWITQWILKGRTEIVSGPAGQDERDP